MDQYQRDRHRLYRCPRNTGPASGDARRSRNAVQRLAAVSSYNEFARWNTGGYAQHGGERASMNYPLMTSLPGGMMKVLLSTRPQ